MPKERKKSPRQRLFFALDFPDEVVGEVVEWQRSLADSEALRLVPRQNIHSTLVFLGHQYERDMEKILSTAREAIGVSKAITIRFSGIEMRPKRSPRIVALSIEDCTGRLTALSGQLARNLSDAGLFKIEARPFWPHATIARFSRRRPKDGHDRQAANLGSMSPLPESLRRPFSAVRVALYSSNWMQTGSVYKEVAHLELSR